MEWKTIGELGEFFGGLTGKSKKDFENGNAKFITYMNVFSNPSLDVSTVGMVHINEGERQNKVQKGDILFSGSSETPDEAGMSCVITKDLDDDYYMNSFCFGLRLNQPDVYNLDYFKHVLRSFNVRLAISKTACGVTRFNISKSRFSKVQIPIPSLEEQNRIVGILDTFTASIDNLKSQIEQRKKQHEHYRDQLLDLEGKPGVEWKPLEHVFELHNGYTPSKSHPEYWENGNLPWFRMEDIRLNGGILSDSILHITPLGIKKSGLFPANTIIVATTATIGEHALLIADSLANQQFTALIRRKSLTQSVLPRFAYYYCFLLDEWCKKHINLGGFASVDMVGFKKFPFPLMSIEVQQNIIDKLETFEASISNLKHQLAQRQKQYEYYRNKLLNFE